MKSKFKIKFVGLRSGLKPLKKFTDGNTLITLPMNQSRAFSHEHAAAILRHSPDRYKKVIRKAKKNEKLKNSDH